MTKEPARQLLDINRRGSVSAAGEHARETPRKIVPSGDANCSVLTASLSHSYRYAWAERAKVAGYPERFAQEALGHKSKAVHRAYARKAQVTVPALEENVKEIVPMSKAIRRTSRECWETKQK